VWCGVEWNLFLFVIIMSDLVASVVKRKWTGSFFLALVDRWNGWDIRGDGGVLGSLLPGYFV